MGLSFLQSHHILGLVGGVVLFASVVLYFFPAGKMRIPAVVTSSFGGIMVGLAAGILLMAAFGYQTKPIGDIDLGAMHVAPNEPVHFKLPDKLPAPNPNGLSTPNPKSQLLHLIHALEATTISPGSLTLTPKSRVELADHFKSLLEAERVNEENARQKYLAVMTYLDKEQPKLEQAGLNVQFANEDLLLDSVANPYREGDIGMKVSLIIERLTKREAR
jgi:hypothetical protein